MKVVIGAVAVAVAAACGSGGGGGGGSSSPEPTPPVQPPPVVETPAPQPAPPAPSAPPAGPVLLPSLKIGDWTFFGGDQGLSSAVHDASADEAGNVYVAGYDALYVKKRDEDGFRRVDPKAAGLTENCYGTTDAERESFRLVAAPAVPPSTCPVISVAGAGPGKAVIGFKGVGTDSDHDAKWAIYSGGADVISFDGTSVKRERHVLIASPPGVICEDPVCAEVDPVTGSCLRRQVDANGETVCNPWGTWADGRLKLRQVQRIAVNRKAGIGQGDVAMGGTHANVTVLVAKPAERGWLDLTKGDPAWADTRFVWEHEHPYDTVAGVFLTGDAWALAFDPVTGNLWTSNQFRTFHVGGYAKSRRPSSHQSWGSNVYLPALWSAAMNPHVGAERDNVMSMSFCDDGTLWLGSLGHGLARVRFAADGTVAETTYVSLPSVYGDAVFSVACDPSDGSLWVGGAWLGLLRLKNGAWSGPPADAPDFAKNGPVRSIQIDRWANRRIVYFSHLPYAKTLVSADGSRTQIVVPGGLTAYAGP